MSAWESYESDRWLLCVPFGPKESRRRVALIPRHDGWSLEWYEERTQGGVRTWRRDHGAALGETEGFVDDLSGAQRWGLMELAVIARDRSERYARQTYGLMSQIVHEIYPNG